jgi:hypothetical protein
MLLNNYLSPVLPSSLGNHHSEAKYILAQMATFRADDQPLTQLPSFLAFNPDGLTLTRKTCFGDLFGDLFGLERRRGLLLKEPVKH